ncbi:hypothetical protein U91I_03299 [alpha proteobacterium U9-1i]|nr:hypothetical protein U91I_03299 [alpha proteobacterium U9-1i]
MQRRTLFKATLAAALTLPSISRGQTPPPRHTQWRVRGSEGFDAIAFLGPLAGGELYMSFYAEDARIFSERLPAEIRADIAALTENASTSGVGLLAPNLSVLFSVNEADVTLTSVIEALDARAERLLPAYRASQYWSENDWGWFDTNAPRLAAIFTAMRAADFTGFRNERIGELDARIGEVQRGLAPFNVIRLQEKLTGRTFDPIIDIVLLQFSKPHGIKVQGQTFLQSHEYDTATTVRIAAHEMLHPPIPMDGAAAQAALAVLRRDDLITRIVRDHNPQWGYTTLEGMLNEDICQALDQLISEALGVARNPADRWRLSDDGMHVIAAGIYGMLRDDRWIETGGNFETWLADAVQRRRFAPRNLHAVAARVLERPRDALWPLTAPQP